MGFFTLIFSYTLFTSLFLIEKVNADYPIDSGIMVLLIILVISVIYILVVSMALDIAIMLTVMIFMTISIFF